MSPAPPKPLAVRVVIPHSGPIDRIIALPGSVHPRQQSIVYAKVGGYLRNIPVDRGDHVATGDLLAEIEVPELISDLTRANAEVTVAKTDYGRLSETLHRAPDLVVPLTVDTARARLEMAQATVERYQILLSFARLTAPFSGVVTKRWVDVGALIPAATSSGSPMNSAVVTLVDFSTVRVEVFIPEKEVPNIRNGAPFEFQVDELPGQTFSGEISRMAYALDDSTRTMPVEIDLPNPDGKLRPGMFGTARLSLGHKASALLLPKDALVTEKAKTSVFILSDGKARKIPIQVGFDDGKSVEIREGLKNDAGVILTGKLPLTDGLPVQKTNEP